MIKKSKFIIPILVLILGYFVYSKFFASSKSEGLYQTATVVRDNLVSTISVSGSASSLNSALVTTSATGVVKKVYLKDGDTVKADQKIAEIDLDLTGRQNAQSAYASYQSAKNSLTSAQNSLRSAEASLAVTYDQVKGHDTDETLAQKETRTKAEVSKDNAYLAVINAQANISSAWLKYQQSSSTIYAPISGTISGLTLQPGTIITSTNGAKIANIQTQAKPLITATLTEVDVAKVKLGQKATITFDSITDKTFTGSVISIDTVGSVSSGVVSYPLAISLDTTSDHLFSNMAATAKIVIDTRDQVLVVPSSAVKTTNGQTTVQTYNHKTLATVEVETGLTDGSSTEIISGLNEGDTVITSTTSTTNSNRTQTGSSDSVFGGSGGFMRITRP